MVRIGLLALMSGCALYGGVLALTQPPTKQEAAEATAIGSPIAISAILGERDSAGGIDVSITWRNLSGHQTIKYCWFDVEFINSVGDVVSSSIGRDRLVTLEATGPVPPDKVRYGSMRPWERAFYHSNANACRVASVSCEYTDGTLTGDVVTASLPAATGVVVQKSPY